MALRYSVILIIIIDLFFMEQTFCWISKLLFFILWQSIRMDADKSVKAPINK